MLLSRYLNSYIDVNQDIPLKHRLKVYAIQDPYQVH